MTLFSTYLHLVLTLLTDGHVPCVFFGLWLTVAPLVILGAFAHVVVLGWRAR
jgi:hypothetical protein